MNKFYINQRVKALVAIESDYKVIRGQTGFIKKMPREGIIVVEFFGEHVSVFPYEIEPYPPEQLNLTGPAGSGNKGVDRRVNIDPVVRDMFDALKAASDPKGSPMVQRQVGSAIGRALAHFKGLKAVTLEEKESVVDETFPGIYRETRACVTIYSPEEWHAMMDVLYVKALHSRAKGEVGRAAGEPGKGTRIVQGGIKPIKAKDLKNLG